MAPRHSQRHIVLYSGGQERRNALIHESLLDLALRRAERIGRRGGIRMTYVPFTVEGAMPFFRRFERRYRAFGATRFECVPADAPDWRPGRGRRRPAAERLLASDIVYLAGGNTFYFLHHLKQSGLFPILRRYVQRGGVIAGLSAGAHLLCHDIELAGYPDFDCDENEVGMSRRGMGALDLVGFEFFPHYRDSPRYREALCGWTRRRGRALYACRDGSGIVVEGDRFLAHGDVWLFDRGRVRKIGA
jgi:dipeptidase E